MRSLQQRKKKSLRSDLLGLDLREAEEILALEGKAYTVVRYVSYKPYQGTDSVRVLRVRERDGDYELLTGEFITNVKTSQG